mmetsp:Transcript_424/g.977  ORF Transcript_424/g.977 Transcript_424/m.977 type:complete len:159 (+) Transcript_424:408-884(+)|eukprot:CAMPEP_0181139766 /NCGR_PEP_ID=MMETSP1071-20121207/34955_1 /TAXON_ID=35127 /ORGANISM="Thalassiosira sp., Strain NH16" /LENGTH=158 /DNA_ID=CAMNT_0023226691 /DNA_START=307 /DNA_END=783 /DNA_ORIENTATION=-
MVVDASWMVARVFSVFALALGGCLVLFNSLVMCSVLAGEYGVAGEIGSDPNARSCNTHGMDVLAHVLTGIFTGLILLVLNSNICKDNELVKGETSLEFQNSDSCEFSTGLKLIASASMLWLLASFFSMQLDIERSRNRVSPSTADFPSAAHPLMATLG